jgi:prevent-host-death family protein
MARLTATEARAAFTETLHRAAYGKERLRITRHGKELAAVVPIEDLRRLEALDKDAAACEPQEPSQAAKRARFLEQLRSWRDGDPEEQRKTWEQLYEVLKEDGRVGDDS